MTPTYAMLDARPEGFSFSLREFALLEHELAQREMGVEDIEAFAQALRDFAARS